MHTITLFRQDGSWVARHSDPAILELFGTDTIPTAYLAATESLNVRTYIQRLNPGTTVLLATGVRD